MIVWLLHNTLILPGADVWQDNEQHHDWVQLPQSNATSTGLHEHAGTTLRRKRTNIWKTTNLQGRVTDAQLWSKILSMEEMVATTSCKSFPEGDLLPWNSQSWHLNTSRETATTEHLDLQDEVDHIPIINNSFQMSLDSIGRCVGTRTLPSCRSFLVEKSRRSTFAGGKNYSSGIFATDRFALLVDTNLSELTSTTVLLCSTLYSWRDLILQPCSARESDKGQQEFPQKTIEFPL